MLYEPEFWVAVAFVIFLGIVVWAGGFKTLIQGLDARGKLVQAELDEAKRLREEAARVLADYRARRTEAEREAEAIVAAARDEAERASREAHERMTDFINRRTAAAEAKIAQAEQQAFAQVRAAAAETAVRVSETILRETVIGDKAQELLTRSLADVRAKLHS
jgi:F-type H+-transporting ATPase subunit b